jgi:hypothetical protein
MNIHAVEDREVVGDIPPDPEDEIVFPLHDDHTCTAYTKKQEALLSRS